MYIRTESQHYILHLLQELHQHIYIINLVHRQQPDEEGEELLQFYLLQDYPSPLFFRHGKQSKTSKDWDGMRNSKPHHLSSDRSQISCNFMFLHFGLKRVQFVCQSRKDIQIRTYLNSYYTDFVALGEPIHALSRLKVPNLISLCLTIYCMEIALQQSHIHIY